MPEDGLVNVRFHEPSIDLGRFFTTFYCVDFKTENDEIVEDALHPEWAGLRIMAGARPHCRIGDSEPVSNADVMVTGPSSLPLYFSNRSTRMWGVGFLPLGWATFFGQPADKYANTVFDARKEPAFHHFVALADKLLEPGQTEEQELAHIEEFFREGCARFGKEDPRIQIIHQALMEPELPHVSVMAERCDLNQRTLERLCRKHFGFSPKILLRRQRFMRSLAEFMLDPSMGWIGAIDSLYFDQSHFVRDCQDFLGMSPSEYSAMDHPVIAGFMRERMRAHGSAVQTLDEPE
ncbi:helix-turn-helix domain-containing protein [Pontixanthobacter aestiaquae]|uniref:Helix-turn-helix domain-containing protein n=1 Tax=Pontixanthobacter aestiaquae TaxID=1509367 RepID=A0A844Z569_9SPHN|nr:helix-turn-helix domain-containing protein [Pontixanthobacter aestiaquae]MDN3647052.1 helix-turn-helix domain-containing protein [Pontixanthobacter aestiaquae]MXO81970.1 helix-turn-helix domain-containing protein [Pontixanthobacter aestiaquae]